jgi:hypothetical protein
MGDDAEILEFIRAKATSQDLRITQHAHEEMTEEGILLDHILQAISNGEILENYPDHRRGACCLLHGDADGRAIHIVCTTSGSTLIIITVYLPLPPRWTSPTQRRTGP